MSRLFWLLVGALGVAPLRRPVMAPPPLPAKVETTATFSAHKELPRVKPALLQKAAVEVKGKEKQPVYVPKIGIANVTEATAFPPPPPTLNPVLDYQPLDTALGDLIQKQFIEPPTLTPPPNQETLAMIFSCPLLLLDTSFIVQASDGCSKTARSGIWKDTMGNQLLAWSEKAETVTDIDLSYTMPSGDGFGFTQGQLSLGASQINFVDCGLNVKYFMKEYVYHVPAKKDPLQCSKYGICDGAIYLKYEIWQSGGSMVAVSNLVEIFANTFTLSDTATGGQLVQYSRNADWSPKDGCQTYSKEWVVTVGGGALSDAPLRWVLGMFITTLSLRDEERDVKGLIRMTSTQVWTWTLLIGGIVLGLVLLGVGLYLFDKYLRESVTLFFIRAEDNLFPVTMYKNKSYT